MPAWRNRQTHQVESLATLGSWGIEAPRRYQSMREYANRQSGLAQTQVVCPFDPDLAHQHFCALGGSVHTIGQTQRIQTSPLRAVRDRGSESTPLNTPS